MSTSSSADSLGPLAPFAPLLTLVAEQIRPLLGLLVVHTIFGAMLVPLLVALLYFSSVKGR
jgi:hypothetical protein